MNLKNIFRMYTIFWLIAILIFAGFLYKNEGNVTITNYTGIIRGATQKLVKKEVCGEQDNELIANLDAILHELQTGEGELDLKHYKNENVQSQLAELDIIWCDIKDTIYLFRVDQSYQDQLYNLSEKHFALANEIVFDVQNSSSLKTTQCIFIFILGTILYICIFGLIYERNHKLTKDMLTLDPQTKLLNRMGLEEEVKVLLQRNPQYEYCMINFDIHNFKLINASYGYDYGDKLISLVANALFEKNDSHFIASHLDADNFIIVTQYNEHILEDINTILSNAAQNFDVSLLFPQIEFAYGAYKIQYNNESVKDMVSKVTMAHKAVKKNMGNISSWYNKDLLSKIQKENVYSIGIESAITSQKLKMYLQPQIDLKSSKVIGAESLVRWHLENGDIVYPDEFIHILERKGLIFKLDYYMLEQACAFLANRKNSKNPLFKIAVNI